MATNSICPEPRRLRLFTLLLASALSSMALSSTVRAGAAVSQDAAGLQILWEGPQRGTTPGKVRMFGTVSGEGPFEVRVGEEQAEVRQGKWELTRELAIGNHVLTAEVTDANGTTSRTPHQFLVVPEFDPKDVRPVIYVSNAWALVRALGSDRIIVLRPGEYVVSDASEEETEKGVAFKGSGNLSLTGIERLDIVGDAGSPAPSDSLGSSQFASRIVNGRAKGTTLVLQECKSVYFLGLALVHDPRDEAGERIPEAETGGGILVLKDTYQIRLRGCEVTGAGLALNLNKINGFLLEDTLVHDCTGGIMRSNNSKHMTLRRSELLRNGRGRKDDIGVVFRGRIRHDIQLLETTMRGNRPDPDLGLFDLDECNLQVLFYEGSIRGNQAAGLATGVSSANLDVKKSKVQSFR